MDEDEHRAAELEELDALERAAWDVVDDEHPLVTISGAVIQDPRTGEPLRNPEPELDAIDALLHAQERRAALLDLDEA